ncbi:MAG: amidohydrolase family protein [Planctomycetota bacterium]
MILKARHVVPVSRPPIENSLVEVRESRIVDVRRAAKHETGASVLDCGDALLLPGFVNAHTHLELTHLAGKVPPLEGTPAGTRGVDFVGWLKRLLGELRKIGDDAAAISTSVNRGAALCLQAGVTTVGDITRYPQVTRPLLRDGRLRVVSFGEVIAIGPSRDRLQERLQAAADTTHDSERLSAAVSPHALYTCDRRALEACQETAARLNMRLCLHLAESLEEEMGMLTGAGPLADFLRSVGAWDESVTPPGLRPVEYAEVLGLLTPRTLLAHVNYVNRADLECLARSGTHVAYCPRTHAAFHHAPHRFREMLAAGINVCVGTDSLATNPSLSVLEELRHVRRIFEDMPAGDLLAMGTLRGARALGLGDKIGSLEPGKQADLVVISLESAAARDPLENILRSDLLPVQVYVAGRRVPWETGSPAGRTT